MKRFVIVLLGLLIHVTSAKFISDNICLAMPNGQKLAVTGDCGAYIVCEYNTQSIRYCPPGTLFDSFSLVCNWASMVRCAETPSLPPVWQPTTTTTTTTQRPITYPATTTTAAPRPTINTNRPIITFPPIYTTTRAPTTTTRRTTTTTTTAQTTTGSRFPSDNNPYPYCDSDGFYFIPHPSACESYYICAYGMLVLHSCGQGVYWNVNTNQCDFPEHTSCTNLPNPAKPDTSTPSTGTTVDSRLPNCRGGDIFHPSTEDCAKYYICIGSSPILMSCPANYLWNAETSQCAQPEKARCSSLIK